MPLAGIEQALRVVRYVVDDPFRARSVPGPWAGPARAGTPFAVLTLRGSKLRPISVRCMDEREVPSYEEGLAGLEDR